MSEICSLFQHSTISLQSWLYNFITCHVFLFTHSLPQSRRAVMCRLTSFIRSWVRWPTRTCLRRSRISFIMCHRRWKRSPSFLCEIKTWLHLHHLHKLIILAHTWWGKQENPFSPLLSLLFPITLWPFYLHMSECI